MKKTFATLLYLILIYGTIKSQPVSQSNCNEIETKVDEFEDYTLINTPFYSDPSGSGYGDFLPFTLYKFHKNGVEKYYISFSTTSKHANVNCKGLWVIFESGNKWSKPNEHVEVEVSNKDYSYNTYTEITKKELELFRLNKIKKFKVYQYAEEPKDYLAGRFRNFINCVINTRIK